MENLALPAMEEWLVEMMELAEMAKMTSLIREKTIFTFILHTFCVKQEKKEFMLCGFDD